MRCFLGVRAHVGGAGHWHKQYVLTLAIYIELGSVYSPVVSILTYAQEARHVSSTEAH